MRRHQWRCVRRLRNSWAHRALVWCGLTSSPSCNLVCFCERKKVSDMTRMLPSDVGRAPCGCLYDNLGHALLVCQTHVRDVEGVTGHIRLRGAHGELRLVPVQMLAGTEAM
jgi:hypothetical protein